MSKVQAIGLTPKCSPESMHMYAASASDLLRLRPPPPPPSCLLRLYLIKSPPGEGEEGFRQETTLPHMHTREEGH